MGSPEKSIPGTPVAKFFVGKVRRRHSRGSKKSSVGTGSASSQRSQPRWSPRKRIGGGGDASPLGATGPLCLQQSKSSSSQPHVRQRSIVPAIESPVGSPTRTGDGNFFRSDESFSKENYAGAANEMDLLDPSVTSPLTLDAGIPPLSPRFVDKLGGILPGTPSSGYRSLPSPAPKARFTLGRLRSPRSFQSQSQNIETLSTPGSNSVSKMQLNVPNIDHTSRDYLNAVNKGTWKRTNRQKNHNPYVFHHRRSTSTKSKTESYNEETSLPLIATSLSEKLMAAKYDMDRQIETIVFDQDGSPRGENGVTFEEEGDFVEVVRMTGKTKNADGTSRTDDFVQIMNRDRSATELHSLCGCMTTVDDITRAKSFLKGVPADASRRDYKGETPLHAFSSNKALAVNIIGNLNHAEFETKDFLTLYRQPTLDQDASMVLLSQAESFLLEELLPSFPGAIMTQDRNGHIPFEASLVDWIATSRNKNMGIDSDHLGYLSAYTNAVSDAVVTVRKSISSTFFTAVSMMADGERHSERQGGMHGDIEKGLGMGGNFRQELEQASSKDLTESTCEITRVEAKSILTPHARFCLEMLSLIVDQLERMSKAVSKSQKQRDSAGVETSGQLLCRRIREQQEVQSLLDLSSRVVEHVSCIPNLLETIFHINDDVDMDFALSTSIIKRVMVNKHSVGPWLTSMFQNPQKKVSRRAIDYLQMVSKMCSKENKNGFRGDDPDAPSCEDVVERISRLRDFIPSLLSLGESGIEEVSTTLVVNKVLDKMISKPFVATVVLCDAIFLALVIVGFRYAVNGMITGESLEKVLSWIYVANTGIFYFIIGEIGKLVSLFLLNQSSRRYFLSFWNLIDNLAIVLALASSVAMRWKFGIHEEGFDDANILRGLLAVTTGFLWLRVLSFLKAVNIQLATFILAIITITKDILFFCVILLTLVISFSQMFFTLLAPSSCASGGAPDERQCKQSEYLLQSYIMLLGDFGNSDRETFTTGFSVFLVVLYSFLVTVILMNVLIAIASDSYEKCLLKSQKLFGRARVMLVAELASFQTLLSKREHDDSASIDDRDKGQDGVYSEWWTSGSWSCFRNWSRASLLFLVLSMIVIFVWTIAELVGFSRGDKYVSILLSLSSVFVNIALYIVIILFLGRHSATKKDEVDGKNEWSNSIQRVVLRVLGASKEASKESARKIAGEDVWHGRVQFLQREMDRIAERQNELVAEQSENFQNMVNHSEARVRAELNAIEQRFKETNTSITSAVDELKALISLAGSSNGERTPVPKEVDINIRGNMNNISHLR